MDNEIDEALSAPVQNQNTRPSKKQKKDNNPPPAPPVEKQESQSGSILSNLMPKNSADGLRRDLKRLMLKNPDLDFNEHHELDSYLNDLDEDQLLGLLEAARFQIGLKSPNTNGISFLGIMGDLSDRIFKTRNLSRSLIADAELVDWVDQIVPSDLTWLSAPFRIINRILYHIQVQDPGVSPK